MFLVNHWQAKAFCNLTVVSIFVIQTVMNFCRRATPEFNPKMQQTLTMNHRMRPIWHPLTFSYSRPPETCSQGINNLTCWKNTFFEIIHEVQTFLISSCAGKSAQTSNVPSKGPSNNRKRLINTTMKQDFRIEFFQVGFDRQRNMWKSIIMQKNNIVLSGITLGGLFLHTMSVFHKYMVWLSMLKHGHMVPLISSPLGSTFSDSVHVESNWLLNHSQRF